MSKTNSSVPAVFSPFSLPLPVMRLGIDLTCIESNAHVSNELKEALSLHENTLRDLSLIRWLESLAPSQAGENLFHRGNFSCLLHALRDSDSFTVVVISYQEGDDMRKDVSSLAYSGYNSSQTDSNFFEFILNNLPADLAVFDRYHRYLFINPKGVADPEMRDFLIGRDDFDYCRRRNISFEVAKMRRARFEECMDFKKRVFWEDSLKGRDGEIRYMLRAFSPVLDAQGDVINVIGYGVDVTDQKEAEIRALEANARLDMLRRFMQHTSDSMIVAEISGDVVYYNRAAALQFGLKVDFAPCHVRDVNIRFNKPEVWSQYMDRLKLYGEMRNELTTFHQQKNHSIRTEQVSRLEKIGDQFYLISIARDISKRKAAEDSLLRKNQLQNIMMEVATAFINVDESQMLYTVNQALGEITDFLRADRGSVYLLNESLTDCSNIFEYCSPGIIPRMDQMQNFPMEHFEEFGEMLLNGQQLILTDNDFSKRPVMYQVLLASGIRGLYVVPFMSQNTCKGFMSFETSRSTSLVSFEDYDLFKIMGVMTMNLLNRIEFIRQIEESRSAIESLNEDLERQVEQKTAVNMELSRTLAAQEKFALLGEIAGGIAHDLNTPLSAIKAGAENTRYVLDSLFKDVILRCNPDQISFAFERAVSGVSKRMQTGSQQRAEITTIKNFLESELHYEADGAKRLAAMISKAALGINDRELLIHVLESENPELLLDLIALLQSLMVFTEGISSSSERAAKVVQNMRQFMRGSSSVKRGNVNLRENIETVLNIFQHELKHKVQLRVEWEENLFINGYENRLFQLWSNLIKNAIEALQSHEIHEKWIWVKTINRTHEFAVIIGNNGPPIPESVSTQIFEKFFTTKHDHGGTGLGLSIVKTIADDHNAEVFIRSSQDRTEFEVVFRL